MRKLLIFSAAFAAAALLICYGGVGGLWLALGCGVVSAVLFAMRRLRVCAVALFGLCAGLLWCNLYNAVLLQPLRELPQKTVTVEAVLERMPERTLYGYGAEVSVMLDGRRFGGILYHDREIPGEPGDILCCRAKLKRFTADDLSELSDGRQLQLSASEITLMPAQKLSLSHRAARLQARLYSLCGRIFPEDAAGLMTALLTGSRRRLTEYQAADLRHAGIYHIVAISGMHVSVLIGAMCLFLRKNRLLKFLLGVPTILLFVLMTGASASAIRAGFMLMLLLLSSLFDRDYDPPTSIAAALLVLLILNPWSITGVGLQLSFAAVSGILLFTKKVYAVCRFDRIRALFGRRLKPLRSVVDSLLVAFSTSVSTAVFSLPLLMLYFKEYSLIGLVSNMLLLWLIPILLVGGMLLCAVAVFSMPAAILGGSLFAFPVRLILLCARFFGNLPGGVLSLQNCYHVIFLVLYYVVLLLFFTVPIRCRGLSVGLLAGCFILCMTLSRLEKQPEHFLFSVLDVGQGQCLVYQSADECAMIDCGGKYGLTAAQTAVSYLRGAGISALDTLIVTHYDFDHVCGAVELLRLFPVKRLILPDLEPGNSLRRKLLSGAEAAGTDVRFLRQDDTLPVGEAVLSLIAPTADGENCGVCVLASCRDYDVLITGDLPVRQEAALIAHLPANGIEAMVAGHHGSADSTGSVLLEAARPQAVLISVGRDNRYGHPSEKTLNRISRFGAHILRTDQNGIITCKG